MSTQVSQLLFCNMSKSRTTATTLINSKSRTVQQKPTRETAKRNLFGSDHEANAKTLRVETEKYHAQQNVKYNFNFLEDKPLESEDGRYAWEKPKGYIPAFYKAVHYADKPSCAAPKSPVSDSVTPPIAQSRAKLTRADLARKVSPHLSNVKRKLSFSCSASPDDQSSECSKNNHNKEPKESVNCSSENSRKISSDEEIPPSVSTDKLKAITSSQSTSLITDYYVTRKRRRPSSSTSEEAEEKNAVESVGESSSSRQLKRKRLQPNQ